MKTEIYVVRLPEGTKEALRTVARKQGLKAPELVRIVLGWAVDGTIKVNLTEPELVEKDKT